MRTIELGNVNTTVLWVKQDPSSNWRVLNKLKFSSSFNSIPRTNASGFDMNDPKNQLEVARELRDGWRSNGPWPYAEFRIEQYSEFRGLVYVE